MVGAFGQVHLLAHFIVNVGDFPDYRDGFARIVLHEMGSDAYPLPILVGIRFLAAQHLGHGVRRRGERIQQLGVRTVLDELACVLVRDVGGSVVHARGIVNVGAGKKRFRLRNAQGVRFYGILEELLVCQAVQLLKAQILFAYGARRMHAGAQVQRKQNDDEHQDGNADKCKLEYVVPDEQVDLLFLGNQ